MAEKELSLTPSGQAAAFSIIFTASSPTSVSFANFSEKVGLIDMANLISAIDMFSGQELIRTSAKGVAGLQEAQFVQADLVFPLTEKIHLTAAMIDCLYLTPTNGETYIIPAALIDYGMLMDMEALAEFKKVSDASAPAGETAPQTRKRLFNHAVRMFSLFACGLIATQALRRADLTSKSAHESFTSLLAKGATQKYFAGGTVAALFLGRSTKETTGDASMPQLRVWFSSTRQKMVKSRFMTSYVRSACKKSIPRLI